MAYDVAPGVQVLTGRCSDNDGMETGVIETGDMETGVIDTGVIGMLISWRGDSAEVVANEVVLLAYSAEQTSSTGKAMSEDDSPMLGMKGYADVLLVPPSMDIGKDLYFQSSCIGPPCVEAQRGSAK